MEIVDLAKSVGKLDPVSVIFSCPSKLSVESTIVIAVRAQVTVVSPPYEPEFGIYPRI